ncbi:MAG TPA: glycosyltransferase family A protein [Solirubrobacterales bacterium]|jgi:glycosyltransferase involved in cell wall biosynthesis|nr:glycosyltransferase family A protein [Solirubrobacterales bacterium]
MVAVRGSDASGEAPRVVVVIPCYNDGEFVGQALGSIEEDEPVEIVVVDDASTDPATHAVVDQLERDGVRVIRHQRNQGLSATRMTGVRATRAPYVFPLDADDLAVAGALAKMADRLDADPAAAIAFGDRCEFGAWEMVRSVPELDPYLVAFRNEYPASMLIRRDVLEEIGGWSADGSVYEDWDLWMSVAEGGYKALHMGPNEVTYRYRVHGGRLGGRIRKRHPSVYATLRERHPKLFENLGAARRESEMGRIRKLLFPLLYGGRRRFAFEADLMGVVNRVKTRASKR